jgi:peptidoglycan/xylan/chitin deacetylase (PgdA/CDA1 family)
VPSQLSGGGYSTARLAAWRSCTTRSGPQGRNWPLPTASPAIGSSATFVGPEQFLASDDPDGLSVLLTFDDGYRDNRSTVLPILEEHAAPAVVFATPELIDADLETYLDWADLRAMERHDLITVGSHSRHHVTLTALDARDARREVTESRRRIEAELDGSVDLFSYPNGGYSPAITEAVADTGYVAAFADRMRVNGPNDERLAVGRIGVDRARADVDTFLTTLASTDPIRRVS